MFRERGPQHDRFKKKDSGLKGDQANAAAARRKVEQLPPPETLDQDWEQKRAAKVNRGVQPPVAGASDGDDGNNSSTGKK